MEGDGCQLCIFLDVISRRKSARSRKKRDGKGRAIKEAFINGIPVGADCSNSIFWWCPSECILFSEMQSTTHNMESHSFDNNLGLMRDECIRWHTQGNQGWRGIGLLLHGGHYYKVTAPSSSLWSDINTKMSSAGIAFWFDWLQIAGTLYHCFLIQNVGELKNQIELFLSLLLCLWGTVGRHNYHHWTRGN